MYVHLYTAEKIDAQYEAKLAKVQADNEIQSVAVTENSSLDTAPVSAQQADEGNVTEKKEVEDQSPNVITNEEVTFTSGVSNALITPPAEPNTEEASKNSLDQTKGNFEILKI